MKKSRTNCVPGKVFKITIKVLPRSLTRICSQLICVSVVYSVYTKPMVSSFLHNTCTVGQSGLHAIFHCFKQVIMLNKFKGKVVEVEQKIIIKNNNLLFQFSDHNNNLLLLKPWKSTQSVIILIQGLEAQRMSYIKFSCYVFLLKNIDVSFWSLLQFWFGIYTKTTAKFYFLTN